MDVEGGDADVRREVARMDLIAREVDRDLCECELMYDLQFRLEDA